MNETKTEQSLVIRQNENHTSSNVLTVFTDSELAKAESFLKRIIASDKGGIKSVNEGIAIMMRAKDLELPFSTCIEHIHVINGKTGVDIHIIKALLSRAQVTWKCIKDYTCLYEYTDGSNIFNEAQLPDYCVICRNSEEAEKATKNGQIGVYILPYYSDVNGNLFNKIQFDAYKSKHPDTEIAITRQHAMKLASEKKYAVYRVANKPIDYVCEYEFTRYRKIFGKVIESKSIGKFTYTDALTAGLFDKDTYKKYPKVLISHRAFTLGARDIASDVLMGCMETTELKQTMGEDIEDVDVLPIETVN